MVVAFRGKYATAAALKGCIKGRKYEAAPITGFFYRNCKLPERAAPEIICESHTFGPFLNECFCYLKISHNMKNLVFMLAAAAALSIISCQSVDKELVDKMQKKVSEMEGLSATLTDMEKSMGNLAAQIVSAPEGMKTGDNPEFKNLLEMSGAMTQKLQATRAEYDDLMNKLKTLSTDYAAGKASTEDARKEYETLSTGLQGISDLVLRIQERATQMETNFAKMSADWNAKQEGAAAPASK